MNVDIVKQVTNEKKVQNSEFICVEEEDLSYSNNCESLARSNVIKVSRSLKDVLTDRFDDFNEKIYKSMKFYDPKFWDNADDTYGEDQITFLSGHFKVPLTKHNFILSKAIEEWQSFKVCIRENYSKFSALNLWNERFQLSRK